MNIEGKTLSGHYFGSYCYSNYGASAHKMDTTLIFEDDGRMHGSGKDEVGAFNFDGLWNASSYGVHLKKVYATHEVNYLGSINTTTAKVTISGRWEIGPSTYCAGTFILSKGTLTQEMIMNDIDALEVSILERFKKEKLLIL